MSWQRRVTKEEFEQHTRPRLMLFLSVDMENSTRLKQNASRRYSREWLGTVVEFLEEFPTLLNAKREDLARKYGGQSPERRVPWKILGDEMIFACEVLVRDDAEREITAMRDAIAQWNAQVMDEKEQRGSLLLKGTAWLAGFPVANAMLSMGNTHKDYVGPSMDAGFRLTKLAAPRRFVLSVDLAWWLLECRTSLRIHFDGRETMKGLAEESGYPLLWLETKASRYQQIENDLLGRAEQEKAEKIKELCEAFISEFGVPRFLPFLVSETGGTPCLPPGYEDELKAAKEYLSRMVYLVTGDAGEESTAHQGEVETLLTELNMAVQGGNE